LGVVIAVLFLISISFTQAQVNIQGKGGNPGKPDKPDKPGKPGGKDAWAVRIPTLEEGKMFYGMDPNNGNTYYLNNGENIKVSVEKNKMTGYYGRFVDFVYALKFILTNKDTSIPPEYYVGYQFPDDFTLEKLPAPEDSYGKPCCQFPPVPCIDCVSDNCNPSCMATFLNHQHPYSNASDSNQNYEFFWIMVWIYDFDIEGMNVGDLHKFELRGEEDDNRLDDLFDMKTQYREGCQTAKPFHNVEIYNHERRDYDIWITRLPNNYYWDINCERIWRIEVNGPLHVREIWCASKHTFYKPLKATGNFSFYIDFIKNPT